MPPITTPKLPGWADPQMASVTDPWYTSLARKGASLIGANDPASQVMGLGGAMDIPEGALGKQLMQRAMTSAERQAAAKRAAEQGFTHDVFHGTKTRADFREFNPDYMDLGIHTTKRPETASSAITITDKEGNVHHLPTEPIGPFEQTARTMPLKARMQKTLEMPDVGFWRDPQHWSHSLEVPGSMNEAGLGRFDSSIKTNDPGLLEKLYREASLLSRRERMDPTHSFSSTEHWPARFREIMGQHGYDSIAYPNKTEGVGELSYMLLHPSQVRSRFARFLPENVNKGDILGSLVGATALGATASPGGSNGQ